MSHLTASSACTYQRRWSPKDGRWAGWSGVVSLICHGTGMNTIPHRVRLSAVRQRGSGTISNQRPLPGASFMVRFQNPGKGLVIVVPSSGSIEKRPGCRGPLGRSEEITGGNPLFNEATVEASTEDPR